MTDWEKEVDSIILDTVKRVKQGKNKENQILLGDLLEIVNRFHLLRAKQRTQLLARVREEVIGEGNEELPPMEAQPYLWAERNACNYLVKEQLKKLEIISEEGKE